MLRMNKLLKRLKIGPYEIAALSIIGSAFLLRLAMVMSGWPEMDSDEGTMGLEAMHIAFRHERPIFLYGQNYMGTLEAYLGALLFRLFGTSLLSLRLGMLLLFTLFLVSLYLLTSLIYSKKLALVALALLSVGSRNILLPEIRAVGGAVETLLFGTLLMLLACWLALTAEREMLPHRRHLRMAAYAGWGLSVGLGLWSHMLVAPFILTSGLILIIFCYREWRTWAPAFLLVGLIIGAIPLIRYNMTAAPGQNSLDVAQKIRNASDVPVSPDQISYAKRLSGTLLFSIPVATNINPYCDLKEMPLFGPATSRTLPCTLIDGGWSIGYIMLLCIAIILALLPLWKLGRLYWARSQTWGTEERTASIIHFSRLMLLTSGALTLALFAASPLAALKPWSTRYLIGLLILTPAVIWPIWNGLSTAITPISANKPGTRQLIVRSVLLCLLGITFLVEYAGNFSDIATSAQINRSDAIFARDLSRMGITRIYSGYWICDRLMFASHEQVVCSVVETNLKIGLNRYYRYHVAVAADRGAPYVFPLDSEFSQAAAKNPTLNNGHYRRFTLDGYVIYQPMRT